MTPQVVNTAKGQAFSLFQQQRFEEAKKVCIQYCKANKKDVEGWNLLGSIYGNLQDMSGAKKCFEKIAKLEPNNVQVNFNLSVVLQRTGDLSAAAKALAKAVRLKPDFFEAHFNLGDIYRQLGQLEQSLASFQAALKLNPAYAPLHLNMGAISRQLRQHDDAVASYKRAIEIDPDYAEAYINLGMLYVEVDNLEEAQDLFQKAIDINPGHAGAYLQSGLLYYKKQDYQTSSDLISKSISIDANNALAHCNLGIALKDMNKLEEAIAAFKQALKLNPKYVDAYHGLGSTLREMGLVAEAIEIFKQALNYGPDKSRFFLDFATVMGLLGLHDSAIAYHQKAIDIGPDNAELQLAYAYALTGMNELDQGLKAFERSALLADTEYERQTAIAGIAMILERRKRYDEAYNLISPFLAEPVNPRVAQALGNIARKLNMTGKAKVLLRNALSHDDIKTEIKYEIEFLLGKLYDADDDFNDAFKYYQAGNETFRSMHHGQTSSYRVDQDRQYMELIKSVFSKEFFETQVRSDCLSEKPVFVVGMPRSGTTLTESIISSHPLAFAGGEMPDISEIRKAIEVDTGRAFPEAMLHVPKQGLNKYADRYLKSLDLKNKDALRVVDKMPHNFLLLGIIALLYPNAHIIHIQRYPIDNCLSIYFQRFNLSHTYATSLKDLGEYYRSYFDLMAHWNEVLPTPILNIRYDELVVNQEAMTRKMIDFCGLDWDERCLTFHKSTRDVGTPSYDQVNQPMYDKSSGRWKNYEKHIGELIKSLQDNGVLSDFETISH